jgi:DNA-directed RNA polymerase specialized sigma24 family protein
MEKLHDERLMAQQVDFLDLVQRARSGDQTAATELVRRFEPFIQRMVRIRMQRRGDRDRLRRDVGSADICQSVFKSLFRGLRKNRYRLEEPADLEKVLHVMIRYNLATKARRSSVKLRELLNDFEQQRWVDSGPQPDEEVAQQDWIRAIQEEFSAEELDILTQSLDGASWEAIGLKLGTTADAARMRLKRAVHRVRTKMGTEDQQGE